VLAVNGPSNEHLDAKECFGQTDVVLSGVADLLATDKIHEMQIAKNGDSVPRTLHRRDSIFEKTFTPPSNARLIP